MAERKKLSEDEVAAKLNSLSGWQVQAGKLNKTFQFKTFVDAFGFMAKAALVAETMNHHPEWFNVYNKVVVDLSTHDVGGISALDFELAEKMDELAG